MNPHLRLRSWFSFAAVAIAACSSSTIKKDPPQQPGLPPNDTVALKQTVKIAVAAVTLGEDCEGLDTQTASAPVANSMNSVASQSKPLPAGKRAPLPLGIRREPQVTCQTLGRRKPRDCRHTASKRRSSCKSPALVTPPPLRYATLNCSTTKAKSLAP